MTLNTYIDHTLLKPFASQALVKKLCVEAIQYNFYAVCVSPYFVPFCATQLEGSSVKISSVIGFPYGYNSIKSKKEDISSILNQTDEFDVVVNLNAVVNEAWSTVENEIHEITSHVHAHGKVIKYILESANISSHALSQLCQVANQAGVDYIKTSTGVLGPGASVEHVQLMRKWADDKIQIKASGGIRDRATALAMIEAGATRIGASQSIAIVSEG